MEGLVVNGDHEYEYDIISWFDHVTSNVGSVQTHMLSQILRQNCEAEYLKKWLGDYNIQDMDDSTLESLFCCVVPLASHADFEPFLQRIADGDTAPLLTHQPITTLSLRYPPSILTWNTNQNI